MGYLQTSIIIPRYFTDPVNLVDLAIYGIICSRLVLPTGSEAIQNTILDMEKSLAKNNDLDEVSLSKLFVLDQELLTQDFMLGVAIFLCFFRFFRLFKIFYTGHADATLSIFDDVKNYDLYCVPVSVHFRFCP